MVMIAGRRNRAPSAAFRCAPMLPQGHRRANGMAQFRKDYADDRRKVPFDCRDNLAAFPGFGTRLFHPGEMVGAVVRIEAEKRPGFAHMVR